MCYLVSTQDYICGHGLGDQDGIKRQFVRPCTFRTRQIGACPNRYTLTTIEEAVPWHCPQCHWKMIQEGLGPLDREIGVVTRRVMSQAGRVPEGNDSISVQLMQETLENAARLMVSSVQLTAIYWHQLRERILREWLGAKEFSHFARYSCDGAMPWWSSFIDGRTTKNPFQRQEPCLEEQLPAYGASNPASDAVPRTSSNRLNDTSGDSNETDVPQLRDITRAPSRSSRSTFHISRGPPRHWSWEGGPPPTVAPGLHNTVVVVGAARAASLSPIPSPEDHSLPASSIAYTESYGSTTPHLSEVDASEAEVTCSQEMYEIENDSDGGVRLEHDSDARSSGTHGTENHLEGESESFSSDLPQEAVTTAVCHLRAMLPMSNSDLSSEPHDNNCGSSPRLTRSSPASIDSGGLRTFDNTPILTREITETFRDIETGHGTPSVWESRRNYMLSDIEAFLATVHSGLARQDDNNQVNGGTGSDGGSSSGSDGYSDFSDIIASYADSTVDRGNDSETDHQSSNEADDEADDDTGGESDTGNR